MHIKRNEQPKIDAQGFLSTGRGKDDYPYSLYELWMYASR
jgi:hypothetical protein